MAVRGKVVDLESRPAGGLLLEIETRGEAADDKLVFEALSDGAGIFDVEVPARNEARIRCRSAGYITMLEGIFRGPGSLIEPVVVVAPRLDLAGRVVDEAGQAIEAARVQLLPPKGFQHRVQEILDSSLIRTWTAQTDAAGAFTLNDGPLVEGSHLAAQAPGFAPLRIPSPPASAFGLELVLRRPPPADEAIQGTVVDPQGHPAPAAWVAWGVDSTVTDDLGRFTIRLKDPESLNSLFGVEGKTLTAIKEGHLPAVEDFDPAATEPIVLELGPPPLAIAGKVLGPDGKPLARILVWVADPLFFGASPVGKRERPVHVEFLLAGEPDSGWLRATTDGDGRFRLAGLLDRKYQVEAMDPETLLRVEEDSVAAGREDVVIRFPGDAWYPALAGRVVTRHGEPLSGIKVFPMCDAFRTRFREHTLSTRHSSTAGTVTGEDGRFQLERVPRDLVYLRLEGDSIIVLEYGRGAKGGLESLLGKEPKKDLEIVVTVRVHLKVEIADEDLADELAIEDADGKAIVINIIRGNGRDERPRAGLVAGRTETLAVPDTAAVLVLYKQGEEIRRVPLRLAAGEVNLIRL
jgi:protocatechuate 3,4-dioxygenase beta subunit